MNEIPLFSLLAPNYTFGGLSYGNTASMNSAFLESSPKKGALQTIELMHSIIDEGSPVICIPSQVRPLISTIADMELNLSSQSNLDLFWEKNKGTASALFANSSIWMANSGTYIPPSDSSDGKGHIVPANLSYTLHRSFESKYHYKMLSKLFADIEEIIVHKSIYSHSFLCDEGAANHMRIAPKGVKGGIHIFIWGYDPEEISPTKKFPARQSLWASEQVAAKGMLDDSSTLCVQQNPSTIDLGVFHNDVIAMSHFDFLCIHEEAYVNQEYFLNNIKNSFKNKFGTELKVVVVNSSELSVQDAVNTYFFNSHFLEVSSGTIMYAPKECQKNPKVKKIIENLINNKRLGIIKVKYVDLSQSMMNGGGPACLRLRLQIPDHFINKLYRPFVQDKFKLDQLAFLVEKHYPDSLVVSDLKNIDLYKQSYQVYKRLYKHYNLNICDYE